ncbi:MAG: hypothetical protein K2N88_01280, partial [Muribaculaceae bacterium]|nr:hypothetical protein [Muribaculaceae bacterium]
MEDEKQDTGGQTVVEEKAPATPPHTETPAGGRDNVTVPGTDATAQVARPGDAPDFKINVRTGGKLTEEDEAVMGYDDQIAAMRAAAQSVAPETEADRKKRERQEKSKKIIAATVDGLSALSNLYFTTQYAPNMHADKASNASRVIASIEKGRAERKANEETYNNLMLKIGDTMNAKAKTLRDLRAQHEAQRLAREEAERKAKEHSWQALLQRDKQREQKGKADKVGYEAITAQTEAEYAPQMQEAKLQTEKARAGSLKAAATNSYASAAAHNRSNPNEFSAWDENGRERKFRIPEAADRFAKQHGTWQE